MNMRKWPAEEFEKGAHTAFGVGVGVFVMVIANLIALFQGLPDFKFVLFGGGYGIFCVALGVFYRWKARRKRQESASAPIPSP